jgi:hypothetical protein
LLEVLKPGSLSTELRPPGLSWRLRSTLVRPRASVKTPDQPRQTRWTSSALFSTSTLVKLASISWRGANGMAARGDVAAGELRTSNARGCA